MSAQGEATVDLSHLGAPVGPMVRVHGGHANRVYRLDTVGGSYAVKELNDHHSAAHVEDVFRFERAAFAAGIPMPEPISADPRVLVHRWVVGEEVPEAPVSEAYAFEVGAILARIHALGVRWTAPPPEEPVATDWPDLAERALATGQPWAGELADRVGALLAIARFVGTCARPGPVVLTHRDVQPWNLLDRGGRPVVLDWELSGPLDLSGELGSTALSIAKGPGVDTVVPAVFHAVLDGYAAAGGVLPRWGPSWFAYLLGGTLGFTRWNVLRCLSGAEASTGPELALSHESVWRGVRDLPDLFARLPQLEALLR